MAVWETLAPCRRRPNLRRTSRIAAVVGCVLTGINQGDVLAEGKATAFTGVKIGLNFVVSNLRVLAASKTMHEG